MSNRNNILDIWYKNYYNNLTERAVAAGVAERGDSDKLILKKSVTLESFLDSVATTPMDCAPPAVNIDEFYKIILASLIVKTDFYYFGTNYNIYRPTLIHEMIFAVEKMDSIIKDALKRETVEEFITLYYNAESIKKHQHNVDDLTDADAAGVKNYVDQLNEKYKEYYYEINTGKDFIEILNELNQREPGVIVEIIKRLTAKYPSISINRGDPDKFFQNLQLSIWVAFEGELINQFQQFILPHIPVAPTYQPPQNFKELIRQFKELIKNEQPKLPQNTYEYILTMIADIVLIPYYMAMNECITSLTYHQYIIQFITQASESASFTDLECKTVFLKFFSLEHPIDGIYGPYFVNYIFRTYFTGLAQYKISIIGLHSLAAQPGGSASSARAKKLDNLVKATVPGIASASGSIKKKETTNKTKDNQAKLIERIVPPDQIQKFKKLSDEQIIPIQNLGLTSCIVSEDPEFITFGNLFSNYDKEKFMNQITNFLFIELKTNYDRDGRISPEKKVQITQDLSIIEKTLITTQPPPPPPSPPPAAAAAGGGHSKYSDNQINKTLKIKNFKNYKNNETKKFRKS